jgi:alkanesulfonate monooxygenase SsuD/methylene tetrahydromethanopterin reductase-like flavin-dependent oxidoreductase (luciferase family)
MRERLENYAFSSHAAPTAANANGTLLSDLPEIEDYVVERFALVGTVGACRQRLAKFVSASGVDGVWLTVNVPDPLKQTKLVGQLAAEFD